MDDPPEIETFEEMNLSAPIQKAIREMGITKPTPIQALTIDPVLAGKDVIAKAETGTGKTLAFGAPMMSKIDPDRSTVLGLVLSPTRELAEQVHDVLEKLGEANGVKTALVVGGEPIGPQVKKLQEGAQVVVGTPGRVLDLMNQRFLQFPWTEFAVLDEADKMLEIGFIDDVKKILDACNEYRNTLLFSATFPPPLLELARGYTTDPLEVATASGVATVDTIHQYVLRSSEDDHARDLAHLIEDSGADDVFLVFCERRTDVDKLMRRLERRRFSVKALHGGYDQAARFRVMSAFRTGEVKCLVATDVASRGLDVAHVTHVVNLGVPRDASDYTHRIGRTGRAGRHGVALTLVSRRAERGFRELESHTGFDIMEIDRPRELFALERKRSRDRADAKDDEEGEAPRSKDRGRTSRRDREEGEPRQRKRRRSEGRQESANGAPDERPRRQRRSRGRSEADSPRNGPSDADDSKSDGFGDGLAKSPRQRRGKAREEDDSRDARPPRKRRARNARAEHATSEESPAKEPRKGPKRNRDRDNAAASSSPEPPPPKKRGGFGKGL